MEIKNEFCNSDKVTNKESFRSLFEGQSGRQYASEYVQALTSFIDLQKDENTIDLSYVCFHEKCDFADENSLLTKIFKEKDILSDGSKITKRVNFSNCKFYALIEFIEITFEKRAVFEKAYFYNDTNFRKSIFKTDMDGIDLNSQGTIFEGVRFHKEAIFQETEFQDKAKFFRARFNEYTSFEGATFKELVEFENFISKDLFYFHNVTIGKINLIGSDIERANFINLKNIDSKKRVLAKENFANKDSVRYLKYHFESQNNITEANKYFAIEQEFFLDSLGEEDSPEPNKTINKISVWFNKYVSYYGTDWVRALIVMSFFSFLASFVYAFFDLPINESKDKLDEIKNYLIVFNSIEIFILWGGMYFNLFLYLLYDAYSKKYEIKPLIMFIVLLVIYLIIFTYFESLQQVRNSAIALINPLNIFNQDILFNRQTNFYHNINFYEKTALYGVFVKFVTTILIYQFIMALRHSTRRK